MVNPSPRRPDAAPESVSDPESVPAPQTGPGGGAPGDAAAPTEAQLARSLDERARAWLREALAEAARAPGERKWELHFASAGRHCGRAAAGDVRVLLLQTAGADSGTLDRLYRQGTAAERAAVLRALPLLPAGATPQSLPLVEDALRANDTSLVAAAVGPYAARHLDAHGWRHAVLKCLFTSVPLDAVAGLERRARGDGELARMLQDFARERTAAGRTVPADLHRALRLTGHAQDPPDDRPEVPPDGDGPGASGSTGASGATDPAPPGPPAAPSHPSEEI